MRQVMMLLLAGLTVACGQSPGEHAMKYPETRTVDQVDDYHGTVVADPYRWLEQDMREAPEVADWIARENALTCDYLAAIPERDEIRARLEQLWDYERYSVPERMGSRYFYRRNDGLQNQAVLYLQQGLDGKPRVLIDPNGWSGDGTVALAEVYPSPDGSHVAYTVQDGGTDWRSAHVLEVDGARRLPETLEWLKFTDIAWAGDGRGFYYSRYPEPPADEKFTALNRNQTVYFHALATSQRDDKVVYARPDEPAWGLTPRVSHDGRHLVIDVRLGTDFRNQLAYLDLTDPNAGPRMLVEGWKAGYEFIGSLGDALYFLTNADAPNGRVVRIDTAALPADGPSAAALTVDPVVAEREQVLEHANLIGGRIIASYLRDARSEVVVFGTDGEVLREVALPGLGSSAGFSGEPNRAETFFSFESFNNPGEIYRYDVESGERSVFRRIEVDFDPADYHVEQVFYTSKDGTRVPMFITYRAGLERRGDTPTVLYGYGGFNISMTPTFSVTRLAWMERGGIFAIANLRGGGEYGETWHGAGTGRHKQNVFDDFIGAAEYLIDRGYTRPGRLGIFGGSNGGLLVGAVTNQRPDLFGAAVPAVGVMDMLRFQRFTAGRFWTDDYGSADDPAMFPTLYGYSPYHNIVDGTCYPAVLATTGDHDDRVVPGHTFKYIARLQAAQGCDNPVLVRVETRAGHGAGKPTEMVIDEYADRWAFLLHNLQDQKNG